MSSTSQLLRETPTHGYLLLDSIIIYAWMNTSSKQGHHKFIAASRATSYSPTSYRDLLRVQESFAGQPSNIPQHQK
jgi:hypothetical protein